MNKLVLIAVGVVTAVAAAVGLVVVVGGDSAEAAPACGVWTRQASSATANDGMRIRFVDDTAIVVDSAGSRFEFGAVLWRDVVETGDPATLEVLASDGNYYGATFVRSGDATIDLTVSVSAAGNQQSWTGTSQLGCTDLALADVACGTWTRDASANGTNEGMQVRVAGDRAIVTNPAAGRYAVGDVLWQNIAPGGEQATLDVLGSDGNYYPGSLAALTSSSLRLTVDVSATGNEQTWQRVGDTGCVSAPLALVACGTWTRLASNNSALDGIEIKITGGSAIVTDAGASWLELGSVLWQAIVEVDSGFTMDVRGSDGSYYGASMTSPDVDTLEVTVAVSASGNQQTWVRVNDVGCGTPAELACGVWERTASTNSRLDGMKVRIEGSSARLTDPAGSSFAIGQELWRNIIATDVGLQLEVLATDMGYYPAELSAEGVDTLTLTIAVSASGNQQTWTEVDASGCVFNPGVTDVVCGVWSRTSSTNTRLDGMSVIVVGEQARLVDPAASRYPAGEVMWRYIVDGTTPATAEVRGSDGNYYAAEFAASGVDELAVTVGTAAAGASQIWVQTSETGCGVGVDVVCGTWERTASSNTNFDGMQIVGSGSRGLLIEPSGSPFAIGEVVWSGLTNAPPEIELEVLATDFNYYDATMVATGIDSLVLDIDAAAAGAEQTWTEINTSGCEQATVTDVVCGLWTRTNSSNQRLDGITVQVGAGRGVVMSMPSGVTTFSVGDVLWRDMAPQARGYGLAVLASDGNYYPAGITFDGAETVELTIDAPAAGTSQTWALTEGGDCAVPELTVCGTWTRTSSNNSRLDGTTVRVESGQAVITSVPEGTTAFATGDVVWLLTGQTSNGFVVDVLATDGNYYSGLMVSTGVDSLTLTIDAAAAGNEQIWTEIGTDGCELSSGASSDEPTDPATDSDPSDTTTTATPSTTTIPPTTSTAVAEGADCIPGSWVLESQPFIESIMAAAGEAFPPGGSFAYEGGTYGMTINADGTYVSTRAEWSLRATTPEASVLIVFNGVQTGEATWDDLIVSADEQTNTTQVQLYASVNGQEFAIPGGSTIDTETFDAEATYECVGDQLRMTSDGVTSVWNRT